MGIIKVAEEARSFFVANRGRMGFSYGLLIGFGVAYVYANYITPKVELVVTPDDVDRMLNHDSVAVFDTKYGPIFTAMQREKHDIPDGGFYDPEVS